jgi:hypothetical protein
MKISFKQKEIVSSEETMLLKLFVDDLKQNFEEEKRTQKEKLDRLEKLKQLEMENQKQLQQLQQQHLLLNKVSSKNTLNESPNPSQSSSSSSPTTIRKLIQLGQVNSSINTDFVLNASSLNPLKRAHKFDDSEETTVNTNNSPSLNHHHHHHQPVVSSSSSSSSSCSGVDKLLLNNKLIKLEASGCNTHADINNTNSSSSSSSSSSSTYPSSSSSSSTSIVKNEYHQHHQLQQQHHQHNSSVSVRQEDEEVNKRPSAASDVIKMDSFINADSSSYLNVAASAKYPKFDFGIDEPDERGETPAAAAAEDESINDDIDDDDDNDDEDEEDDEEDRKRTRMRTAAAANAAESGQTTSDTFKFIDQRFDFASNSNLDGQHSSGATVNNENVNVTVAADGDSTLVTPLVNESNNSLHTYNNEDVGNSSGGGGGSGGIIQNLSGLDDFILNEEELAVQSILDF